MAVKRAVKIGPETGARHAGADPRREGLRARVGNSGSRAGQARRGMFGQGPIRIVK